MSEKRIEWFCDVCGDEISDDDGGLNANRWDLRGFAGWRREMTKQAIEDEGKLLNLLEKSDLANGRPPLPEWNALHWRCIEGGDDEAYQMYQIEAERLRTPEDLYSQTGHIVPRGWVEGSNWIQVTMTALSLGEYRKANKLKGYGWRV